MKNHLSVSHNQFTVRTASEQSLGNTYFISESTGSDYNSGLTEDSPWKTLSKLRDTPLKAGDKVSFKAGDIWYGFLELDLSGGQKEHPIIFTSYGEGKKPSLRYYKESVTQVAQGICLRLNNANGFVMEGLDIGCANLGIKMFYDKEHFESEYVRFTNCHFHDIYGVTQLDNLSEIYFSSGIYVTYENDGREPQMGADGSGWPLKGLYIERCTSYDAGSLVCGPCGVYGFYMNECIGENNGYYGTTVFGCRGGYINHCVFRNNGTRPMPAGSCGIMVACDDFVIQNTIIVGHQRQGSDPDGCGIDFEWHCHNVSVENCLFQDIAGVGVMYFTSGQGQRGTNYDTHIKNCYFINNNQNIGNIGSYDIFAVSYGTSNCVVSDCKYIVTDYEKSKTVDFYIFFDNNDLTFKNNVELKSIPHNLESIILNGLHPIVS